MERRMPLKITFSLLFLFLSNSVLSQQREYIIGKLLDAKTQEPIAFASIRIKDRALGVISNTDGSFKIPIEYKEYGDIIEISSMGYQTQELWIHNFSIYDLNTIRIQPAILELEEAIVSAKRKRRKKLSPKKIVQRAIDAIPRNYPTNPYSEVGYYRDYQLDGTEYVNLNEAILEVFDQGFKANDSATTKVMLYDYSKNKDFKRDSLAERPYDYNIKEGAKVIDKGYLNSYGGNELTILRVHNAIRNYQIGSYSFVHRFDTDLLKEHKFSKEEDSNIGDEPLYTVRFEKKLTNHSAYGRLYISKFDFAIYKMEYAVYDDTIDNATDIEDENGTKSQLLFEVSTSYRKKDAKMYLSYISFHNLFKLWLPPKLELHYVDLRFSNKRFSKLGMNRKKRWLVLTFSSDVDPDYIQNVKKFKVRFRGKRVVLDGLLVSDDQVILYPKMKTKKQIQILDEMELLAERKGLNPRVLQINIEDLKDMDGNLIGEWTSKNYNQFREFFVQQIKPKFKTPTDAKFMNKGKPIYKDQPIVRPDNFDDYWMNTPLKTAKN